MLGSVFDMELLKETRSLVCVVIYKVIHKSLRDFRPLRYSSRHDHAEGEHVNRGRDIPSFCPTLQVLDMSILVVAQPSSEVPEGLMNYSVCVYI